MNANEQKCPICGRDSIVGTATSCPQCNSDLTCFKVLGSLADNQSSDTGKIDASAYDSAKLDRIIAGIEQTATAVDVMRQTSEKMQSPASGATNKNDHPSYYPMVILVLAIAAVVTITAATFVGWIIFARITTLEQRLITFEQTSQTESRGLNTELVRLKSSLNSSRQTLELKLLKQELKQRQLLNQKIAPLLERITALDKINYQFNEQSKLQFAELRELMKNNQVAIKSALDVKLKNTTNEQLERIIAQLIADVQATKQQQTAESKVIREQFKQQQARIEKMLKLLEQRLQAKNERRKAFFSFFKVRFF